MKPVTPQNTNDKDLPVQGLSQSFSIFFGFASPKRDKVKRNEATPPTQIRPLIGRELASHVDVLTPRHAIFLAPTREKIA